MLTDPEEYKSFESELDLFSIHVDHLPIWERIRFKVAREIASQQGQGQPHTQREDGLKDYLRGFSLWLKNAVHRNPYLAGEHDYLFAGHPRRKLEEDGYWWDIYCDPIHEKEELDYVHMEMPHLLSHRSPAKTNNLRYLELVEYGGTIQRQIGLRQPSIPDEVISRLREAEAEIERRFDADIDLVSKVRHNLHVRNTNLPLYERLLDRVDPEVAIVVVSYGRETFIEACKRKEIPVVELQHGVIYDTHFGYAYPEDETKVMFPDYVLTWGEFWNENLRFPIPDERVISVGYPYLEDRLNQYDDVEPAKQLLFISQGTIGRELSQFALKVHEDDRIEHEVVYKLHPGEYDRWEDEYPWLAESDMRVIDESEPPLYRLFAESSAQVGVGSTAVYEGLCFDLETFVFEADGADVLQPLVEDGAASMIEDVDDLAGQMGSVDTSQFDRERFFKSDSVANILEELERIHDEHRK
ncbi:hypothetical protein [Halorubrum lipolyticum]|uniref:hypothetical protein n=1 Tax=Halorubrum lipolyticum TaxID=368624 RepID=UPI0009E4A064|nr:hypothetical protein [Halorubrum lipolyticum]